MDYTRLKMLPVDMWPTCIDKFNDAYRHLTLTSKFQRCRWSLNCCARSPDHWSLHKSLHSLSRHEAVWPSARSRLIPRISRLFAYSPPRYGCQPTLCQMTGTYSPDLHPCSKESQGLALHPPHRTKRMGQNYTAKKFDLLIESKQYIHSSLNQFFGLLQ